jgi:hypothetical protein
LIPIGAHAAPAAPTTEVQVITACMRANMPLEFSVEDFVVTSSNAAGAKESIGGQIYYSRESSDGEPGPTRAMLRIQSPALLRNSAYLMLETENTRSDNMFVYLPAVDRVRRIVGNMADSRLFGTDISYYEFKQFRSAFGDMSPALLGRAELAGRAVQQVRFTPKDSTDTEYDHADAAIDVATCLPLKIEFFSNNKRVKLFTVPVEAIRQDNEHWYMTEFTLEDLVNNSSSVMQMSGYRSDKKLPGKLFSPVNFYRSF